VSRAHCRDQTREFTAFKKTARLVLLESGNAATVQRTIAGQKVDPAEVQDVDRLGPSATSHVG